eukprot:Blabericola_migrator_1__6445@NODE_3252_length_1910_cov_225_284319_g2034_i0_p2_GENE_NODE_3252_length_1910_cov_225_284319_g2034_i0NODE_3252_length_1910_cov_225_284319_g2034_i0_p2_ORF_typecomplete_len108_score8_22_NODE_3252_length_1910_cov_225_284319_g2034_i012561579
MLGTAGFSSVSPSPVKILKSLQTQLATNPPSMSFSMIFKSVVVVTARLLFVSHHSVEEALLIAPLLVLPPYNWSPMSFGRVGGESAEPSDPSEPETSALYSDWTAEH